MSGECPGPHCPYCSGEVCAACGAGAWRHPEWDGVLCEHDTADRHPKTARAEARGAKEE